MAVLSIAHARRLRQSSRHTPCAVTLLQVSAAPHSGGRHAERACYFRAASCPARREEASRADVAALLLVPPRLLPLRRLAEVRWLAARGKSFAGRDRHG